MPAAVEAKLKAMVRGEVRFTSANLGFNLLISRLSKRYGSNPIPAELNSCMEEVNAFFSKYSMIMEREYEKILAS